jgi:two-component system sensor histidine kinase/response regulator
VLPIMQTESLTAAARRSRPPRAELVRRPRWPVLVVEDALSCGLLAKAMLAQLGYEAVVVPNGYEAVAAIEQGSFDVVLMDVQMPVLDGLDATRLIRSRWPERRIPIYAVTGALDTANAFTSCVIAGMDGVLTKPIRLETLAELLGPDDQGDR